MRTCLINDKELPVKVEAALALQFFIKRQPKGLFVINFGSTEKVNVCKSDVDKDVWSRVPVASNTSKANWILTLSCFFLAKDFIEPHMQVVIQGNKA